MSVVRPASFLVLILGAVALLQAQTAQPVYRQPDAPDRCARGGSARAHDARGEGRAAAGHLEPEARDPERATASSIPQRRRRSSALASARWRARARLPARPADRNGRSAREQAVFVNAVQRWLIENTRLGIPAMFHEEALHGLTAPGGTHFPVPMGLASTWDPALVERRHERGRARRPRARRAARALAGRRSRARSALGAHRGNLRRGSAISCRGWASPPCAATRAPGCRWPTTRSSPR